MRNTIQKETLLELVESLPPLPESIKKMEALFSESDYPAVNDLVKIIESDPALNADILASTNSPLYGFTKAIRSIQQAVVLFGAQNIRKMALKSAIFSSFKVDMSAYGITNDKFLKIASMQSDLIFQWYMGVNVEKAKLLIPLGFLLEVGALVISRFIIDQQKKALFLKDIKEHDIQTAELRHTNMTTTQVNYLLFEHWGLNDMFINIMKSVDNDLHKYNFMIDDLAYALRIVRTTINLKEQFTKPQIIQALKMIHKHDLDKQKFLNVCVRIKKKYESI